MGRCWSRGASRQQRLSLPARSCMMSVWASVRPGSRRLPRSPRRSIWAAAWSHRLPVPGRLRRFRRQYCKIRRPIIRWCNCAAWKAGRPCSCCPRTGPPIRSPPLPVTNFPPGCALATVFVNGIPSTASVLNISVPVPTATTLTGAQILANGSSKFTFTNSAGSVVQRVDHHESDAAVDQWTVLGSATEISPGHSNSSTRRRRMVDSDSIACARHNSRRLSDENRLLISGAFTPRVGTS